MKLLLCILTLLASMGVVGLSAWMESVGSGSWGWFFILGALVMLSSLHLVEEYVRLNSITDLAKQIDKNKVDDDD